MSGLCTLGTLNSERVPAMTETVTMSYCERDHLKVIVRIEAGELTVAEAAESVHVTERQMYRLLRRYRQEGDRGLIHRLRGRRSNLPMLARSTRKRYACIVNSTPTTGQPFLLRSSSSITTSRSPGKRPHAGSSKKVYGRALAKNARIVRSVNAVIV